MKSTMDKLDGLTRKLNVEVPADQVKAAFDRAYKGIQKNANIKGFRKGKAPLATIRSMYGEKVKGDVLQDIISESYQKALSEHSVDPIGYPKINFDQFNEGDTLQFTAEVEVRPEVNVEKYEGLEVEKEKLEITDEQVNQVLENIRENQAELTPVFEDRGVQEGDVAEIDFEGFVNGAPLEGGSAEGHLLEIGAKRFIPGFEEGLMGMKIGEERDVDLSFPEDYHAKEIAGQPVKFHVKLKGLKKRVLPEVNDELAKKVGDFESVDQLKDAIREDIKRGEERRVNDELRNRILKKLVEANPVEVPQGLLAQQKEMIINDVKNRMAQQGMSDQEFEEYKKKWDQDFEDSARFMVQSTFLVDALSDKLNLRANQEDFEQKVAEFAAQMGVEAEKVRDFYNSPEQRNRMTFQITEEKVVKELIDKANVKEVEKDKLADQES